MSGSVWRGALVVLLILLAIVGMSTIFTVHQAEQALVLRFGRPVRIVRDPGLQFKVPFVDSVVRIDKRILDLDLPAQEVIASDQKRLVVDAFTRYHITDPLRFYQAVGTVEAANNRLATFVNSSLRRVLGDATFIQVVRDEREKLMERIRTLVNDQAQDLGVSVNDVKIRRADLPEQNSQAIYQRMQTERQREAAELRAQGAEAAQRIRARADREVTVNIADANRDAERLRGQGDAEKSRIFAEAYNRDPGFFDFYRSMQAYETALPANDTRLVLTPKSEFFRYFGDPSANSGGGVGAAPAPAPPAPTPPAASASPAGAAPAQ
jgi:membrane protease subunit HflC